MLLVGIVNVLRKGVRVLRDFSWNGGDAGRRYRAEQDCFVCHEPRRREINIWDIYPDMLHEDLIVIFDALITEFRSGQSLKVKIN